MLMELSVVEQRYQAVLAVIRDGVSVVDVASRFGVAWFGGSLTSSTAMFASDAVFGGGGGVGVAAAGALVGSAAFSA